AEDLRGRFDERHGLAFARPLAGDRCAGAPSNAALMTAPYARPPTPQVPAPAPPGLGRTARCTTDGLLARLRQHVKRAFRYKRKDRMRPSLTLLPASVVVTAVAAYFAFLPAHSRAVRSWARAGGPPAPLRARLAP